MNTLTLTHRKEAGEDYEHISCGDFAPPQLAERLEVEPAAYQYYVTEWKKKEIVRQINADEWLAEYKFVVLLLFKIV